MAQTHMWLDGAYCTVYAVRKATKTTLDAMQSATRNARQGAIPSGPSASTPNVVNTTLDGTAGIPYKFGCRHR